MFGPLQALLGTVAGWNVFVLLTYVGAGGFAALWLRALGLGVGPALVGGLAFALAPYRVAQSTGHLLGPISMLLPLALYGVERRRTLARRGRARVDPALRARCTSRSARSRSCSRTRSRGGGLRPGRSRRRTAVAAGVLVWALSLRDTAERPFTEVERYSATLGDFVAPRPGRVRALRLPRLARSRWPRSAGLGCLCFRNTISSGRRLALVLGLGALVPCLLALGSNLPGYGLLWRNTPLHSTRVPERLLPIACLCLAALAAVAIACVSETQARSRLVAAVACVVVAADLWVPLYDPLVADEDNALYAAGRRGAAGAAARAAGAAAGRLRRQRLPLLRDAGAARAAARLRDLGAAGGVPGRPRLPERADELGVRVVVEYRDGVPRKVSKR